MSRPARDLDAACAYDADRVLPPREWTAQADRLATGLAAHGVGAADKVAVRLRTRLEWLVVTRALSKLGAVQVALNY
nr:AMP-binding protein [Micromonospora sp. DSM 115978]